MKHFFPLLLAFSIVATFVGAQPSSPLLAKLPIPPSPTAASLGAYGEVGVSYYTGLPDISIPLYEAQGRSISLPISLQYNASGTKVAENASWVGLGWSLSAGGVITRTVRGLDDFKDNGDDGMGYYYAPAFPSVKDYIFPDRPTLSYDKLYFSGLANGRYDAEADVYNYNFGSYAGKFVLGKQQANGAPVFLDEQNNLQIVCLNPSRGVAGDWLITDPKGYQYLFAAQEQSSTYTYASNSEEAANDIAFANLTYQPDRATITTAWYLSSITAPTGEVMQFEYSRGESVSLLNKAEEEYNMLSLTGGCQGNGTSSSAMKGTYKTYTASKQVITDRNLKKITFSQGTIEFNASEREDIEYRDSKPKPAKLSEILIKDGSGATIKRYAFQHSYFGNYGLDRRLKLDAVVEYGQDGTSKPPYNFTYNTPDNLPSKYSKSVDHWGYYNDRQNLRLLPELTVGDYNRFLAGADRQPDTLNTYPKQGVLSSIRYPTGGRTEFDYELHTYFNLRDDERYKKINGYAFVHVYDEDNFHNIEEFDIYEKTAVTLNYSYSEVNCAQSGCQLRSTYKGLFFLEKGGIYSTANAGFQFNNSFAPASGTPPYYTHESGSQTVVLSPGHYHIRAFPVPGYSLSLSASWQDRKHAREQKGGGLRIKSITNYDGDKLIKQRQFIYTADGTPTGLSSGVLITHPKYDFRFTQKESKVIVPVYADAPTVYCDYSAIYVGRMSSLVHPIGFTTRATIGYNKVTELVGETGEGGKTEYIYHSYPDISSDFPLMPTQGEPRNGKLQEIITYDKAGILLQKTEYEYDVRDYEFLPGVKLFISPAAQDAKLVSSPDVISLNPLETPFSSKSYSNFSAWCILKAQKQTQFTAGQAFATSKTFAYDNAVHKEITREQSTTSTGRSLITRYLYPADYTGATGFIGEMKAAHILNTPVEQVTSVADNNGSNEQVLSAILTTYLTGANIGLANQQWKLEASAPIPLPEFKYSNQTVVGALPTAASTADFSLAGKDGHYPIRAALTIAYTAQGQRQQLQRDRDVPTTYLWGYNNTLPVAQIDNASANQVQTALNSLGVDMNALPTEDKPLGEAFVQLRIRLPQARITSFTHQPLIGLKSKTGPDGRTITYEYDAFQRLIRTRDEQRRILSQQQYHYAGR